MPANKNAVIRYKYLDLFLSDKHHYYDIHDLTEMVNNYLAQDGDTKGVGQRTIEQDLVFLQGSPFYANIIHEKRGSKYCIHYEDPQFSIFKKALSTEEENLLREVLNTIGQFDGLANFEWLDGLKKSLNVKDYQKVISFSSNPYQDTNLLGSLFSAISNKAVIKMNYHTFDHPNDKKSILFHPYLLKEYNNRWFLIGAADSDGFILHFALDRIDSFVECPEMEFHPCEEDLIERFEDIIGVTLYKDVKPEQILLWVSDRDFPYVDTKPLHGSYKHFTGERDKAYREKYPDIKDGHFIGLECIINNELRQLIGSFLSGMVVLEPLSLRQDFKKIIESLTKRYKK